MRKLSGIKGKGFGGCVRYVMNDSHELLEAEGVFADSAKSIIRSFAVQRSGRKEIKQPVGHIPISFSLEDTARMTYDFFQLAKEYMEEKGIKNTQYIIVRHHKKSPDYE
ncbi:relaxase/mobilization nuclease domain-containing protein [Dysgonomonas alginatilytica]